MEITSVLTKNLYETDVRRWVTWCITAMFSIISDPRKFILWLYLTDLPDSDGKLIKNKCQPSYQK